MDTLGWMIYFKWYNTISCTLSGLIFCSRLHFLFGVQFVQYPVLFPLCGLFKAAFRRAKIGVSVENFRSKKKNIYNKAKLTMWYSVFDSVRLCLYVCVCFFTANSSSWAAIFDFGSACNLNYRNKRRRVTTGQAAPSTATNISVASKKATILLCKCFNALFSRSWFYNGSVN